MVKLRLRRIGKKKQPIYKIVVADSRAARTGKFLEAIGSYNPRVEPMAIDVKEDRLFTWLKRGAEPTDTLRSLLRRKGLWLKWDLTRKKADDATIAAAMEKWQMLQADKLKHEAERKARRKAARKLRPPAPKTEAPGEEPKPETTTPV